jgi:hypothetical protein
MNDPSNPLGWAAWRRGALLGLRLALVLFAATGVMYGLLGITGWSGTVRALCAMGVGPLAGVTVIALWWIVRRPALVLPGESSAADEADPDRTETSRRTLLLRRVLRGEGGEQPGGGDDRTV